MASSVTESPGVATIPQFQAGDIILFAGEDDLYSKVGGWLMRGEQEGPTYAVHTAQFVGPEAVLEMDFVAKLKSLDEVLNRRYKLDMWKRRGFEVWRCETLSQEQREVLSRYALTYLNVKFSMLRFLAHLLDNLLCKAVRRNIFFFRRIDPEGHRPVCSSITAFVYDRALDYRFGVEPACADPDHIHDWVMSHPDEWARIFYLEEYGEDPARKIPKLVRMANFCKELVRMARQ
ncbi:MAG TPA: hypothetical protein VH186_12065 [Chloroflexia bacterium]|nr:hypothetical protein [Chloroflexia bacterium]